MSLCYLHMDPTHMNQTSRKTVLIVDDDRLKGKAIQRWLSRKHPDLSWAHATCFSQARDMMNEIAFDFVITDANMPIEKGSENTSIAFRFMLKECGERGVPAVVCSGMQAPGGFTGDWVEFKPGNVDQLNDALRRGLGWS